MTETKPPRGRKLGVKVFEDVYMPELETVFETQIALMKKKTAAKKLSLRDVIKEDLGGDEIVEEITGLVHQAQEYERQSEALSAKSQVLLEKASAIIALTKIYKYDIGYNNNIQELKFEFSDEVTRMVDVAIMLHPEWLDLREVEHWRAAFRSKMRSSVTMEQCTEVIAEARQKVAELQKAKLGDK